MRQEKHTNHGRAVCAAASFTPARARCRPCARQTRPEQAKRLCSRPGSRPRAQHHTLTSQQSSFQPEGSFKWACSCGRGEPSLIKSAHTGGRRRAPRFGPPASLGVLPSFPCLSTVLKVQDKPSLRGFSWMSTEVHINEKYLVLCQRLLSSLRSAMQNLHAAHVMQSPACVLHQTLVTTHRWSQHKCHCSGTRSSEGSLQAAQACSRASRQGVRPAAKRVSPRA